MRSLSQSPSSEALGSPLLNDSGKGCIYSVWYSGTSNLHEFAWCKALAYRGIAKTFTATAIAIVPRKSAATVKAMLLRVCLSSLWSSCIPVSLVFVK